MRIGVAALIWILFIGGLTTYMLQRGSAAPSSADKITIEGAQGTYSLVVTTTFTAQPDPFALTNDSAPPAALLVRMGQQILLSKTDDILPGQPMGVTITDGLVKGTNEILVQASPPLDNADQAQAVRVQLLRDDWQITEQTYWAAPGENISEVFRFDLVTQLEDADHDH